MDRKLCGAPAPGGRRRCELHAGHVERRHAYRTPDGRLHEWTQAPESVEEGNDPGPDEPRLGQLGQIYVTGAAATRYAAQRSLDAEEARRELTELLLDARVREEGGRLSARRRSNVSGLDVSAIVVRERGLLVVTAVNVRPLAR